MSSENYFFAYLTAPNIIAAIAVVNVWTFMLFGLDKIRAEEGSWRISEAALLNWSFFGGTPGAMPDAPYSATKPANSPFAATCMVSRSFKLLQAQVPVAGFCCSAS
jgi:uncharacterized membrane protein YsdA (DUF1294 family)